MTHTPGPWDYVETLSRATWIKTGEPTYQAIECQRALAERDRLKAINASLVDALISMLNVEGAAMAGRNAAQAWKGLDVKWHFNKARAVLAKANETQL